MYRIAIAVVALFAWVNVAAEDGHEHTSTANAAPRATEDGHDETHDHGAEHGVGVSLDEGQRRMAGVRVEPLSDRELTEQVRGPGEVRLDAYATAKVAPRITAQVVRRHARLGDHVEEGESLVTLSSVEMASAQGELKVAQREWERVRRLGREVVSERRHTEARIAAELARARVRSYGMSEGQVAALLGGKRPADGEFALLAPRGGTVIADDFVVGDVVSPGTVLMTLTDESSLWVEARLTPEQARQVAVGAPAGIRAGSLDVSGEVSRFHHALDQSTRTLGVRIAVLNPDHRLHAGQFVDVWVRSRRAGRFPAVPREAVLRDPGGHWTVFVEEERGHYRPAEVELVRTVGEWAVIGGLEPGAPVVTHGAFFVRSELAKGGFEVHRH